MMALPSLDIWRLSLRLGDDEDDRSNRWLEQLNGVRNNACRFKETVTDTEQYLTIRCLDAAHHIATKPNPIADYDTFIPRKAQESEHDLEHEPGHIRLPSLSSSPSGSTPSLASSSSSSTVPRNKRIDVEDPSWHHPAYPYRRQAEERGYPLCMDSLRLPQFHYVLHYDADTHSDRDQIDQYRVPLLRSSRSIPLVKLPPFTGHVHERHQRRKAERKYHPYDASNGFRSRHSNRVEQEGRVSPHSLDYILNFEPNGRVEKRREGGRQYHVYRTKYTQDKLS